MTELEQAARLRVYVFSYNRVKFLENCAESVLRHLPGAVLTIIDDDSEERRTLKLLARYERNGHAVLKPSSHADEQTFKTGGLYANKTIALNDAIAHGADYALYMHDDQQIVRTLRDGDIERFDRFFEAYPACIELHTCFLKHDLREADQANSIDATGTAYFRDHEAARGHKHFSGSGLFHVARTREQIGVFALGEKINEKNLRDKGIYLGFYAWPFMGWLPFPISYRGKRREFSHRVIEWLGGGGFHPINDLSEQEEKRFLERDIAVRPVAEDMLVSPGMPKAEKWSTMGGFYNAGARRGFKKAVARLIWKRQQRRQAGQD